MHAFCVTVIFYINFLCFSGLEIAMTMIEEIGVNVMEIGVNVMEIGVIEIVTVMVSDTLILVHFLLILITCTSNYTCTVTM